MKWNKNLLCVPTLLPFQLISSRHTQIAIDKERKIKKAESQMTIESSKLFMCWIPCGSMILQWKIFGQKRNFCWNRSFIRFLSFLSTAVVLCVMNITFKLPSPSRFSHTYNNNNKKSRIKKATDVLTIKMMYRLAYLFNFKLIYCFQIIYNKKKNVSSSLFFRSLNRCVYAVLCWPLNIYIWETNRFHIVLFLLSFLFALSLRLLCNV